MHGQVLVVWHSKRDKIVKSFLLVQTHLRAVFKSTKVTLHPRAVFKSTKVTLHLKAVFKSTKVTLHLTKFMLHRCHQLAMQQQRYMAATLSF